MAHQETNRMVDGAKTAVLFLHGICGTPDHFRILLPLEELVPDDWSVYNVLMEGHGKRVEDFSHSSMQKWKAQVFRIFDDLCSSHDQVIVVGHSMGTLFAIQMACRCPQKVPFVLLIASPMRVGIRISGAVNLLRFPFNRWNANDPLHQSLSQASSIIPTKKLWKYLGWIPRMLELLREIKYTENMLSDLIVPAIACQSIRDEMVSNRSDKILEDGRAEVVKLPKSTHFYYDPEDMRTVQRVFTDACEKYA